MDTLASLFVGRPLPILAVAVLFLAAALAVQQWAGSFRRAQGLFIATGAWALYAAWEWLILVQTPEANIRVDLLLIWPLLSVLSLVVLVRVFRR